MKKLLRKTVVLLLAGTLGLVIWKVAGPSEPEYQGKLLSAWLERHVPSSAANPPYNSPGWRQAEEALRQIGTNAIPTLLRMIRAKDSSLKLKLVELARKQRLIGIHHRYATARNEEAEYAFQVLGSSASNAVPELIKIYEDDVSPSSRRCAALALGSIGPPAKAAVPVLLRNFTHTNAEVRFYAVSAILHIGGDSSVVLPALKRILKDPKVEVRWNAIVALSTFGASARTAVSELLEELEDQAMVGNDSIKEQVEIALWRIAPEKVGKPLVVEESTPMAGNGVTTEALDVRFNGERKTLIPAGRPVPCVAQLWNSEPRAPLSLYRGTIGTTGEDHHLGHFEVLGMAPPPADLNVSVLCVIANQQIFLCARDNNRKLFLEIRRVKSENSK